MKKITRLSSSIWILAIVALVLIGRYIYKKPNVDAGEAAPVFTGQLLSGEPFALNSLKGDIVLLDFWGSWCGPCRGKNAALVALYKKYENDFFPKGGKFKIVSVAIEKERDAPRWKRAIQKDGLYWKYHLMDTVSNYRFFDSAVAKLYGVVEVPTTFLLNENLQTVMVNAAIKDIDAWLMKRRVNGNN